VSCPLADATTSDVGLLGKLQCVVYLDAEAPDRALRLPVTDEQLAGGRISP
jgi:hypothetical protein